MESLLPFSRRITAKTIGEDIIGMRVGETWGQAVRRHILEQRTKKINKLMDTSGNTSFGEIFRNSEFFKSLPDSYGYIKKYKKQRKINRLKITMRSRKKRKKYYKNLKKNA